MKHLTIRIKCICVLSLTFVSAGQASAVDSLVFVGRLDKMEMKGLLRNHISGEDWVHAWYAEADDVPAGYLVRRFQSVSDSVYYLTDTITGGGEYFDPPIVHGDFNGDTHTDYVGSGYWILTGNGTGYYADTTGGQYIDPKVVGDFDGDGLDDVFGSGNGGSRIWWGDSTNPLHVSSFIILPPVEINNDTIGGFRVLDFIDRYNSVTVAAGTTTILRTFNTTNYFANAWRLSEAALVSHQDTIGVDSVLTQASLMTGVRGNLSRRIGDTTILQGSRGQVLVSANGCEQVADSGEARTRGKVAGFGMDWPQHFLQYDYHVTDSVVTILEFDKDSLKYRYTYEFRYGHVDSGSRFQYCSMFPDVTADGYLELGVTYIDEDGQYYTNVYDVFASLPATFVIAPIETPSWGDASIRDGRIYWKNSTSGDCIVEMTNISGKVMHSVATTGERVSGEGIEIPVEVGSNGVLVIRITQHGLQQTFKTITTIIR